MPSLRNRKVKGSCCKGKSSHGGYGCKMYRSRWHTEDGVHVCGRGCGHVVGKSDLEEIADTMHSLYIDYAHIGPPKPTIDEYVKGCFGCGAKTDGKYCCVMCNHKYVERIRVVQDEKKERERWKDECCKRIKGGISTWLLEAIANDLGIDTA